MLPTTSAIKPSIRISLSREYAQLDAHPFPLVGGGIGQIGRAVLFM